MSTAVAKREPTEIIEQVVAKGDLKELTPAQRTDYYRAVCESIGLNPLTKPFEYITLNNKLTLYARKDATDQLRKLHSVSVQIVSRDRIDDVYAVTARATDATGRTDESIGAVSIGTLKGDALCNALMKAETKAKRRVTLSICGLGMLDEAELETMPPMVALPEPPEAIRNVKPEGAQPTYSKGTQEIMKLINGLQWGADKVRQWMEAEFNYLIETDDLARFFDAMQTTEQRKIFAALREAK
jgi:hypothetical protein